MCIRDRTNTDTMEKLRPVSISSCRLERLENNNLSIPTYATKQSAGIDFAACLTRQCFDIKQQLSQKFIGTSDRVIKYPFFCINTVNDQLITNSRRYNPTEAPVLESNTDISLIINPGETILVPLGWTCDFNTYYNDGTIDPTARRKVMQLYVRSSIGLRGLSLANGTGIIDSDYRGELMACVFNHSSLPVIIEHGERIVQGIIQECCILSIHLTSGLGKTERGEGGFGSTGK